MAEKRKAHGEVRPNKKAKTTKPLRDEKKPADQHTAKPAATDRPTVKPQVEKAFPRGGASVLTPLEKKQIHAQAERDVLFEQSTGQKAPKLNSDDEDDDEDDHFFHDDATPRSRSKIGNRSKQGRSRAGDSKQKEHTLKTHSLSYKTLVPGSLVLGRVTAITSKDLALALPNNLTGFVPLTAVSSSLNKRIEAILREEEQSVDEEESTDDVELQKLFRLSQWLRAVVVESESVQPERSRDNKRHIELSLDPLLVNNGLSLDSVVLNTFLQASVRSVEDHGVIMDVCLQDKTVRGFIGKKELGLGHSLDQLGVGQVMLCLVTAKSENGKVLKLTPDASRFTAVETTKRGPVLSDLPDINGLLPGVAVDVLITDSGPNGVTGKIAGLVDVSADATHSESASLTAEQLNEKFKIGSKVRARIIWSLPKDDESRHIGISFLAPMLALPPNLDQLPADAKKARVLASSINQAIPTATTVKEAEIVNVVVDRGLLLQLSYEGQQMQAFAHISQLSDTRITDLYVSSGPYKVGSRHQARVLNFNPIDGIYYVSLKPSIISEPFIRLEDVKIGSLVDGQVERLMLGAGIEGVTGILIRLAKSVTALVPAMHMSDTHLKHPEQKFREGMTVKGRVLSTDIDKRQIRVTLKKTLVFADDPQIWNDYTQLAVGDEASGTIVKLLDAGAVVQYYGAVRAFLPVAEMSEAYVGVPAQHFRLGQTVNTRILSVNAETAEMRVSCRLGGELDEQVIAYWDKLAPGQVVSASISSLLADKVEVELDGGITGIIRVGHLLDGSENKAQGRLKMLNVGQKLNNLVVLDKSDRSHQIALSNKSSMVTDAQEHRLISSFDNVKAGGKARGFVQNITPEGVYVEFAGHTVGLLGKRQLQAEMLQHTEFGLRKDQSITVWVEHVDQTRRRFSLTMHEPSVTTSASAAQVNVSADFSVDQVTGAKVATVKSSQINVRLADGVHGRIDVSEVFDSLSEIETPKNPLQNRYSVNQNVEVKILGIRNTKNWKFLPFSHRTGSKYVVELSMKRSRIDENSKHLLEGLAEIEVGATYVGFVNNVAEDCVWVSLSPAIRGRISHSDLTNDLALLQDVHKHFPIGSSLQVKAKNVSPSTSRLDLIAIYDDAHPKLTLESVTFGDIAAVRVTKVTEHGINVQLSDELAAFVPLVELADDFDEADPTKFSKHDIVRARVMDVDNHNKRISLSLRPSLVLSSSLPVKDLHITNLSQLKSGALARGFVKHIGDKSVLVSLSGTIDAFVTVSDLSDAYIKDWQSQIQLHQLVKGRVLAVDPQAKTVRLSLKASQVEGDYKLPLKLEQLEAGMIVTGVARKVEDYGVFIDLDNTQPRLSGLAHRSELAEKRVNDVRGLYSPGDKVKAKILAVDPESRKISLGLKASYFSNEDAMSVDDGGSDDGVAITGLDFSDDDDDNEGVNADLEMEDAADPVDVASSQDSHEGIDSRAHADAPGLVTSGFDWTGESLDALTDAGRVPINLTTSEPARRAKSEIKLDLTDELDKHGPRTTSDFERQLLGQPNDSGLWIQYMAHHLQLSEVQKAREIAERALRAIHIREVDEKANIWVALINLEVEYGDDDGVEDVFKKACQAQDPLEMHEKLASIYIDSGKQEKADGIFERIIGNKAFRASPDVWLNYATFLMTQLQQPEKGRVLLARAMQSVAQNEHRLLTAKFAALEFRAPAGNAERGRTIFEALVSEWPRWTAGWDMWVDLERARLDKLSSEEVLAAVEQIRGLYDRMSRAGMKKRRANFVFKRWLEFEDLRGDKKHQDKVKSLAKQFVEQLQAKNNDEDD